MTDSEREYLQKTLDALKKQRTQIDVAIASFEQELRSGNVYRSDHESFKQMCKEMKEFGQKERKNQEQHEIEQYGRILTHAERRGWVYIKKDE